MKYPCGILRDIIDNWKNPIWYTVLHKTEKIRVQPQCRKRHSVVVPSNDLTKTITSIHICKIIINMCGYLFSDNR